MGKTALEQIAEHRNRTGSLPAITLAKKSFELKKLSQKHKIIVALHLQGLGRVDIGSVAGCTPEYVSMIVKQPLAQEYLKQIEAHMDEQMRVNGMRAVEIVGEKLNSDDEEIQLKAARLALEANGKLKPSGEKQRSAEDVVAAILAKAGTVVIAQNAQVNQGD